MAAKKSPKDSGSAGRAFPAAPAVDRRAVRALFGTYWTAGGWRSAPGNTTRTPPPAATEVKYARAAGYMFEPRRLTHDQIVAWLLQTRAMVS